MNDATFDLGDEARVANALIYGTLRSGIDQLPDRQAALIYMRLAGADFASCATRLATTPEALSDEVLRASQALRLELGLAAASTAFPATGFERELVDAYVAANATREVAVPATGSPQPRTRLLSTLDCVGLSVATVAALVCLALLPSLVYLFGLHAPSY